MIMSYQLLPNEITFDVRPFGIGYKCEFCNAGVMNYTRKWRSLDPENPSKTSLVYEHKCSNCGRTMELPKIYPYIEYETIVPPTQTTEEVINNDGTN